MAVLRAREPGLPRPVRTWGCPWTPALLVLLAGWMVVHSVAERPAASLAGLATLGAGLVLHRALGRAR